MASKLDLLLWTQQYKTNSFHTFYKHFYIYIPCYHSGWPLSLQSQSHENHDFRISRFWSVQETLLSAATRTVPNGPVFERRSLRSVLQKVLYSLPATPLPGTPSQHRTDPREGNRTMFRKTNSRRFARVLQKVNTTSLGRHREVPVSLNVSWEGETCN